MSWFEYILLAFSVFFLTVPFVRELNAEVIHHFLNKSTRRKKKKGQSFIDWLLYRRFRDVLPKSYLVWYYIAIISFVVISIATFVLSFFTDASLFARIAFGAYFYLYTARTFLIYFSWGGLFSRKRADPGKTLERKRENKK